MAKVLQKRQWAKFLATHFSLSLINSNQESPLIKSYWNTYHCSKDIFNDGDKLKSKYCKNRWCAVCNRIRTAVLINAYEPSLKELNQLMFVTLTIPTCTADELPNQIKRMQKAWRQIYVNSKKPKYIKEGHPPLRGIKKSECTIRPENKYHYHYHILVNNWSCAEWLVSQWLSKFPEANRNAQDIRLADNRSMKELFKYFTKILSKNNDIDYGRLDIIFQAMKGKRVFQSFGIKQQKEDFSDEDLIAKVETNMLDDIIYTWLENDWYGKETGVALVGEDIPESLKRIVENKLTKDVIKDK